MSTPYPKTCALLRRMGIDPNTVSVNDLNESGYSRFVLDRNGKKIRTPFGPKTTRAAWPDERSGRRVVAQFRKEEERQ